MTIRWHDDDEEPLSPAELQRASYERRKYELSRAWLKPTQAPWSANEPRYWNYVAPPGPVANVMIPAAVNPAKGAGPVGPVSTDDPPVSPPSNGGGVALTREEIAEYRAREREEFAERLQKRWIWNLRHM
jgi:hypothetical protein